MLTKTGYDIIVLQGLQSLRREIDEAEQYTVQQYQQHTQEEKNIEEWHKQEAEQPKEEVVSKVKKGNKESEANN